MKKLVAVISFILALILIGCSAGEIPEVSNESSVADVSASAEADDDITSVVEDSSVSAESEVETSEESEPETSEESEVETSEESEVETSEESEPETSEESETETSEESEVETSEESEPETSEESEPETSEESEPETSEESEPETSEEDEETSTDNSTDEDTSNEETSNEESSEEEFEIVNIPLVKDENIDPEKPMVALTFDDGPGAYTERLLDILAENGANCTFFVVGNRLGGRPDTLKRMVAEGHEIGNHSWDHDNLSEISRTSIIDQITRTNDKIFEITGVECRLVRPPYGSCNDKVKDVGARLGVAFVNWSVDTLDWKTRNAEAVYNSIISNAENGEIILCHDIHKSTVDAMETVIPKLIEDGYQLVTVSQLMAQTREYLVPGKMHYRQ